MLENKIADITPFVLGPLKMEVTLVENLVSGKMHVGDHNTGVFMNFNC